MPRLSLRRRRRTKLDTVKDIAQIYTTLKLSQAGGRAAKKAAKGYAGVKAAKGSRRVAGPVLGALGIAALIAFLKKRNREPTGYEPPAGSSPGSTPSAYPSGSGVSAQTTSTEPAPAGEPEAPTGPSGGAPGIEDLSAGSMPGRESFPLGSSVSAEEDAPAGSPAAPKSGSTQAGEDQA
jgi:hypothetical protein